MKPKLLLCVLLGCATLQAACKKETPPPSYPDNGPQNPAASYPTAAAPAQIPAPAPAPVAGAAALGLPCSSEQDLQCAFSHCIGNRCGGCRSSAECKAGSQCLPTWLGYACFPGGTQAAPSPAPSPVSAPGTAPGNSGDALEALRARCVQRTNELRARVSLGALGRRADRETCIDGQAQNDAQRGAAHGAFGRCQEGGQNECPGWPGPLDRVIDQCLEQMFAEGPGTFAGHGHYLNMIDPKFGSVACGFSTAANGQIWLIQNFYR